MNNLNPKIYTEASNLYVMYNELLSLSYKKEDYNFVLKYFYKLSKYFNIIYSDISENQIINFKNGYSKVKELVINASKALGVKILENIEDETLDTYEKLLLTKKNKDEAYNKIAQLLQKEEAYISAIHFLKRSLQINPNNYENYRILGDFHHRINDLAKAIAFYEKYIELSPDNPLVYNILGTLYSTVYKDSGIERQIYYFKKALEIYPKYIEAIRNLAIAYRHAENYEESLNCYLKLIKSGANNTDYFNYACLKIKLGDFKEGWKYFEYRFKKETNPVKYPEFKQPRWDGKQNIKDKILLVQYEQGLGDSIAFLRYLPQIKAKKVIFRVQDSLTELFKSNVDYAEIIAKSVPIEEISFDYHIPIMSLPYALKAQIDNIPLSKGYLKADTTKVGKYKKEFFDNDSLKIGITWHGAKAGNDFRDIPLKYFYTLSKIKNVKIYSFQKDFMASLSQDIPSDFEIKDLGKTFNDFSDTAAAMENIDLFVTSDNGVCNLAAAMGKKTFLLLNTDPEWRWFLDEEKTPWYDSIKIFKKKNINEDWDVLMQRVIDEINKTGY